MLRISAITSIFFLVLILFYRATDAYKPKLVWSDEFKSGFIQPEKWTVVTGNGCPDLCGFGNNEAQYYTAHNENIRVDDDLLVIEAHKDSLGENGFTSAKLVSKHKGDWQTGIVEVRAKLPEGNGTWPAIWMLPTLDREMDWPLDGEIDIMEHVGYNQGMIYGTIHTDKYNHTKGTQKSDSIYIADAAEAFHVYKIEWSEEKIEWFVDDQKYNEVKRNGEDRTGWPFDEKYHLILNLAVGGNWGGRYGIDEEIWPQQFSIDYVRVYQ